MTDTTIDTEASVVWRKGAVYGGRLLIIITLIGGWDYGARTLGRLFFAPPLDVLARIIALAQSGEMFADILATLRVSVAGFVIAAVAGGLFPLLLRHSPPTPEALEPVN